MSKREQNTDLGTGQRRPELLAPAGSFAALEAGLEAGADAVYFGLSKFNARNVTEDFCQERLPEILERVWNWGAKAYLTLNTLLYDEELGEALALAEAAYLAGVDAVIVQDLGLIHVLRRYLPELELHGSTQLRCSSASELDWARSLGLRRVVLAREMGPEALRRALERAAELDLDLEFFIQGAYCISMSGHCHMSQARGGRSANRGLCAQACRLGYQLQRLRPDSVDLLGDSACLLSAADLSLYSELPSIARMGLHSLKIEGRKRSPAYVRAAVAAYRRRLDSWVDPGPHSGEAEGDTGAQEDLLRLRLAYSKGAQYQAAHFLDQDGRNLITGRSSGHLGIELGQMAAARAQQGLLCIKKAPDLRLPQGALERKAVLLVRTQDGMERASCPVGEIWEEGDHILARGFHPAQLRKFQRTDRVYLQASPAVELQLQKELREAERPELRVRVQSGRLTASLHAPRSGLMAQADMALAAPAATGDQGAGQSSSQARWFRAFSKLGGRPYRLGVLDLASDVCGNYSMAELNELRRKLLADLDEDLVQRRRPTAPACTVQEGALRVCERELLSGLGELNGVEGRDAVGLVYSCRELESVDLLPALLQEARQKQVQEGARGLLIILPFFDLLGLERQEARRYCEEGSAYRPERSWEEVWTRFCRWRSELPSDVELGLRLPPLMEAWQEDWLCQWLPSLGRIAVCCTMNHYQMLRARGLDVDWYPDQQEQVLNRLAALYYLRAGAHCLSPALEFDRERLNSCLRTFARLWRQAENGSLPPLWTSLNKGQAVMYSKHCPVGQRRFACRRCAGQHFALDQEGRSYQLLCKPRGGCMTEIYDPDARPGTWGLGRELSDLKWPQLSVWEALSPRRPKRPCPNSGGDPRSQRRQEPGCSGGRSSTGRRCQSGRRRKEDLHGRRKSSTRHRAH